MKASKLLIGLFALSMLALSACSANKDSGAPVRSGYNGTMNGGRGSGFGSYAAQYAQVQNFNPQAILGFLSASSTGTSQVGQISSVQVAGSVGLGCNSSGQPVIVSPANGILLNIIDSLAAEDGPIQIFMPVAGGQVWGGQMNLTFQDSLGTISVTGTYNPSSSVQGQISYRNNNGQSGVIGTFVAPISSFLQCQAGY